MIFGLLFLCKDAKKPLHFATRYGIFTLYHATQRWFLRPRQGTEGKFRLAFAGTAQRPSASVIEAADAMREVAGNVAQNNCIHYADAHDACHGKSDRKTGWADRETRAAPWPS